MGTKPFCIGLLLAGGHSTRMGRDKALIPFHGRPLIDHMRELIDAAGVAYTVVSGSGYPAPCIPDRGAHVGPVGGIASVLAELRDLPVWLLVVPVDMPLLRPELLRRLVAGGRDDVLALHYANFEFPALLRVGPELQVTLAALLQVDVSARDRSVKQLLAKLRAETLPVAADEGAAFANANTPEDWFRAEGSGGNHES